MFEKRRSKPNLGVHVVSYQHPPLEWGNGGPGLAMTLMMMMSDWLSRPTSVAETRKRRHALASSRLGKTSVAWWGHASEVPPDADTLHFEGRAFYRGRDVISVCQVQFHLFMCSLVLSRGTIEHASPLLPDLYATFQRERPIRLVISVNWH